MRNGMVFILLLLTSPSFGLAVEGNEPIPQFEWPEIAEVEFENPSPTFGEEVVQPTPPPFSRLSIFSFHLGGREDRGVHLFQGGEGKRMNYFFDTEGRKGIDLREFEIINLKGGVGLTFNRTNKVLFETGYWRKDLTLKDGEASQIGSSLDGSLLFRHDSETVEANLYGYNRWAFFEQGKPHVSQ